MRYHGTAPLLQQFRPPGNPCFRSWLIRATIPVAMDRWFEVVSCCASSPGANRLVSSTPSDSVEAIEIEASSPGPIHFITGTDAAIVYSA